MIGFRTQYKGLYNDEHVMTDVDSISLTDLLGDFQPSPKPSKGERVLPHTPRLS